MKIVKIKAIDTNNTITEIQGDTNSIIFKVIDILQPNVTEYTKAIISFEYEGKEIYKKTYKADDILSYKGQLLLEDITASYDYYLNQYMEGNKRDMNKIITTKNIKEEITLVPTTEYAYVEIHTTIKGLAIYNGSIWGIEQIPLNEDGMLKAQVNGDSTAIILHGIRDIQVTNTTEDVTQYIVNIIYKPTA